MFGVCIPTKMRSMRLEKCKTIGSKKFQNWLPDRCSRGQGVEVFLKQNFYIMKSINSSLDAEAEDRSSSKGVCSMPSRDMVFRNISELDRAMSSGDISKSSGITSLWLKLSSLSSCATTL